MPPSVCLDSRLGMPSELYLEPQVPAAMVLVLSQNLRLRFMLHRYWQQVAEWAHLFLLFFLLARLNAHT